MIGLRYLTFLTSSPEALMSLAIQQSEPLQMEASNSNSKDKPVVKFKDNLQ